MPVLGGGESDCLAGQVKSLKLSTEALRISKMAHTMLSFYGAERNRTLSKQLKSRPSILRSLITKRVHPSAALASMEVSSLDSLPNPPVGVNRLYSSAYGTPQPDGEDSESRVPARLENENGIDRLRHTGAGSELMSTVDIRIGEESRPESSTLRSGTDDELRATVPDKGGKASAKESDESATVTLDSRSIHTNVAAAWLEPESGSDRLQRPRYRGGVQARKLGLKK